MTSLRAYLAFILLLMAACSVYGDDIVKGSLTFVIDDTASMSDEIEQVKESVNYIFDTVVNNKESQIENFVLVTFNDPDAVLLTVTKDRNDFKRALARIYAHGGGLCPEYAMTGIKLALKSSLPQSLVYVFTDASSEDYAMFEEVRNMAQKNQVQVTFLLTGECASRSDADYQVYHQLANATAGDVYNMIKNDVKDIMNFITERIKGRDELIASGTFPPGYGHEIKYKLDGKMGNVYVSAAGRNPTIELTDDEDKTVETEDVVKKTEILVKKVPNPKPGVYTAKFGSETETSAKVRAKTTVNIEAMFSGFKPTSPSDTASRPAPDGNTYISIQLHGEGVTLESVVVLDMSGKELAKLPLRLIDEKNKFYAAESFDPPKMFRVEAHGYDDEDKSPIKREAATPIERQNLAFVTTENVAPTVTIDEASEIITDYNAPVQLKCRVHAYPKPSITWQEKSTGVTLAADVSTKELPYDYISLLSIEKVTKNATYECKATNFLGGNFNYVDVGLNTYFNVIETPKEILNIEYDDEARIVCKVDASPPATITWSKNGKPLSDDTNLLISSDITTITIKHVNIESQGKYICEAKNDIESKTFSSNVYVTGLKKPEIYKTDDKIQVLEGDDTQFECRITEGKPRPTIRWYFQRKDDHTFEEIDETGNILKLRHTTHDNVGTYKCVASNFMGSEQYAVELVMNYPPTIKDNHVQHIRAKDGDSLALPCDVDGVPSPTVTWRKNDIVLDDTIDTRINTDNSLKIREMKAPDSTAYICKAENLYGTAEKTVYVDVFVPVTIQIPNITSIATLVGSDLLLPCVADGYPKPRVEWSYIDFNGTKAPMSIGPNLRSGALGLRRLQLKDSGYYTCIASNVDGSSNITFSVEVNAPPVIEDTYPFKTFKTIKGDLVLRIECKASGSPEPTIVWKKNGLNIASGSVWYEVENGTLIIKNIDAKSEGDYVCFAQNKIGHDFKMYKVVVDDYPIPGTHVSEKFITADTSANITCDIPHKKVDLLRWYKDRKLIATGELTLDRVTVGDEGIYSCRVSNMSKSMTAHVKVIVGYKPYFFDHDDTVIPFERGDSVELSCDAGGEPKPEVTWYFNNKTLNVTEMIYDLDMEIDNIGEYTCEVKNGVGSINRTFTVVAQECILDATKHFLNTNQPIMTTLSLAWPSFNFFDHYMVINKDDTFYLHCPKGFNMSPNKYVLATCEGGTNIKIGGKIYKFSEIQCNAEIELTVYRNSTRCLRGNTESVQVGYTLYGKFLKVYEVCVDKTNRVPLYAQHEISSAQYNVYQNVTKWNDHSLLPFSFDSMYDCNNQASDISSTLGTPFHQYDDCCFDKRQLVNPKDLRPGVPTASAYTYLNVVPHWSTCNSKNWANVEERVRELAKSFRSPLKISTGTAKPLRMASYSSPINIVLHDDRGRKQPVAEYLWKVVLDRDSSRGLAIIQINVPDLSPADVAPYVLCKDICNEVKWMQGSNWHNMADGYTYCCSIREFESKFHFYNEFSDGRTGILRDVFYSPKY